MHRFRPSKSQIVIADSVDEALDLIESGESAELEDAGEIDVLLDKLLAIAQDAENDVEYDLCQVTVAGTNLFCEDSLGVKRLKMPQLSGKPKPGSDADKLEKNKSGEVNAGDKFVEFLGEQDVDVQDKEMSVGKLKPSQGQLVGTKIAEMVASARDGSYDPAKEPIFVSRDGYIVDGHHRWAAIVAMDAADDGEINGSVKMQTRQIDMNISDVLKLAKQFTEDFGILAKDAKKDKSEEEEYSPVIVPPNAEEIRQEKQKSEEPADSGGDEEVAKGDKVRGKDKDGEEHEGEIESMSFGKPKIKSDGGKEVTLVDYEKVAKMRYTAAPEDESKENGSNTITERGPNDGQGGLGKYNRKDRRDFSYRDFEFELINEMQDQLLDPMSVDWEAIRKEYYSGWNELGEEEDEEEHQRDSIEEFISEMQENQAWGATEKSDRDPDEEWEWDGKKFNKRDQVNKKDDVEKALDADPESTDESGNGSPDTGERYKGTDKDGKEYEGVLLKMIFGRPRIKTDSGDEIMLSDWGKTSKMRRSATNWDFEGQAIDSEELVVQSSGDPEEWVSDPVTLGSSRRVASTHSKKQIKAHVIYVSRQDRDSLGLITVVQDWEDEVSIRSLRTSRVSRISRKVFDQSYEESDQESEFALFL